MDKKKVFVVLVSAFVIMICLTYQGTYSYFTATVEGTGNRENNTSTGQTDTLENLILSEGSNVVSSTMIPGDSVTYTFTVQNPNNIDVCFNLLWSNTTNTFVNQKDLVVKLEKGDGTVLVNNKQFPATNSGTTELLLGTSIKASTTDTYTLTVTYLSTDEDQTADMDKSFSGTIIGELGECAKTAAETILAKGETDELKFDNTADNNLRYVGADPNNYVLFNNELWRIIGIFSEDTHGVSEAKLVKIIRSESLGDIAWDTAGINDWSTASLQTILNGDYLNGSGSYASTGIKSDTARNMIETITWKLGGSSTYNGVTPSMFYERERGTAVYSGRPTTWSGKVALMYPSDYGYATSGGSTTNRESCLAKELYKWSSSSFSDCKNNDWLYDSSASQWTLTPSSSYSDLVFGVSNNGYLNGNVAYDGYGVRPSIYLKSNIGISGGTGVSSDPYKLSIQ